MGEVHRLPMRHLNRKPKAALAGKNAPPPVAELSPGPRRFKDMREKINRDIAGLAPLFWEGVKSYPADFRLRIARIAMAMYVVDCMDDIFSAIGDKDVPMKARAARVYKNAQPLLDAVYASDDPESLRERSGKLLDTLGPISSKLGIRLLTPEEAVNKCIPALSDEIDRINRKKKAGQISSGAT